MFDDVIVTAILLTLCVVVIGVMGVTCRLLSAYQPRGRRCPGAVPGGAGHGDKWPPGLEKKQLPLLRSDDNESRPDRSISSSSPPSQPSFRPIDVQVSVQGPAKVKRREEGRGTAAAAAAIGVPPPGQPEVEEQSGSRSIKPSNADSLQKKPSSPDSSTTPPPMGSSPPAECHHGKEEEEEEEEEEERASIGDDVAVADVISGRNIRRALSCDSVMSDTSSAETTEDCTTNGLNAKIGQLEFGLQYDVHESELVVSVVQAKDLEKNPNTGSQDSFVKLWLTPHDDRKQQTQIRKGSVNPQYSERFRFRLVPERLDESSVQFQVYSCDRYARQKLIGETEVRLGDIDFRQPVRVWMALHEMDQKPVDFGDVMFSLAYLPTAERLTAVIAKARNLHCPVGRLSAGCFAKVHLLQRGRKVSKKKTSVKHEDRNPIFNESMTFIVPAASLATVELRISVLSTPTDKTGEVNVIGHVTVGPKSTGMELVHWTQTMTSLRKPVTMWHSLRRD